MPKLFKIGEYSIFFWSDEDGEPIHVHIIKGNPSLGATKVWLTKSGGVMVAHNKGKIPQHELNQLLDIISTRYFIICNKWKEHFESDDIKYYC